MDILLTFTGFHDPYAKSLVGDDEVPGPILSLVLEKRFDRIFLISTPNTEKRTTETLNSINKSCPHVDVELLDTPLDDPTDYLGILRSLRTHYSGIIQSFPDADYYVSVASGTPQMHACWLLLTASGEIPAQILHTRPPRFVTKDRPSISAIDLTNPEFPIVKPNLLSFVPSLMAADFDDAVIQMGIIGDHPKFRAALETAGMLAQSDVPVTILGETGTGKDVIARFVHRLSQRSAKPFIPINCAALPENLIESILFGHVRGAFTGATTEQKGKFDQADNGTLFLDELGELPLAMQAKLLRVLQDGIVEPLGSSKSHKVNVRVIAATNKDLRKAIAKGLFREDLYYRLNLGEIHLPSLRERRSDIPKLALAALERINMMSRRHRRLSPEALDRLQKHSWPGNIRALENVIGRAALLTKGEIIQADELVIHDPTSTEDPLSVVPDPKPGFSLDEYLSSARKQLMLKALELAGDNKSEAARLLGITPQAVHKYFKQT